MSKQPRVATDPDTLKPIIEAMVFASEEPLSARALLRLLAGDRENERPDEDAPEPAATPIPVETAGDAVTGPEVDTEPVKEHGVMDSPIVTVGTIELAPEIDDDEEMVPATETLEATELEAPESDLSSVDEPVADTLVADAPADDFPADDTPAIDPPADEDVTELAGAMERAGRRLARPEGWEVPATLDQAYLRVLIDELNDEYEESGRVFRIVEVAGGFQFATIREFGEFVAMLSKDKARRRLSPAALETLAIIAYRQPVSKPEMEAIRGVNCDQVLLSLMEKTLVAITGRSEGVGRPLLYGTTEEFLRIFGLKGLGDLPKLREIEELMEEDAYSAEKAEVITIDADTDVEEIEAKVGAAGHVGEQGEDGLPVGLDGRGDGEGGTESEAPEQEDMNVEDEPVNEELEMEGLEIEESETEEFEMQESMIGEPEMGEPEPEKPEIEEPEIDRPEVETPEVETPEIENPGAGEPEIETPEIDRPEIGNPEGGKPEIEEPHPANGTMEDHEEEENGEMARDAKAA